MTPLLRRVLTEWLEWATNGAPPHPLFSTSTGLCDTVFDYCDRQGHTADLCSEFEALLIRDFGYDSEGLSMGRKWAPSYPFGGQKRWGYDFKMDSMHTNELRLEWVRKVLSNG